MWAYCRILSTSCHLQRLAICKSHTPFVSRTPQITSYSPFLASPRPHSPLLQCPVHQSQRCYSIAAMGSAGALRSLLTAALTLALLAPATARQRRLPVDQTQQKACKSPEPAAGTRFDVTINRRPDLLPAEDASERLTLLYKESASLVTNKGEKHTLGNYAAAQSTTTMHVFDGGDVAGYRSGSPQYYKAIVLLKCSEDSKVDDLVSVSVSPEDQHKHTYVFNIHSSRVCPNQLPCPVNAEVEPIPEGDYVIYKPSMQRLKCPGIFLSAQYCGGHKGLELAPMGPPTDLQRWTFSPAEAESAMGRNLLSQPVAIRSLGRAAGQCGAFLGLTATGAAADCAAGAGLNLADSSTAWVVESGPPIPPGSFPNRYYIRAQALAAAGCPKSYLCLSVACEPTSWQLCDRNEEGFVTWWHIRPADTTTLASQRL